MVRADDIIYLSQMTPNVVKDLVPPRQHQVYSRHTWEGPRYNLNIHMNHLLVDIICCWTILVPLTAIVGQFSGFVPS
jgi:hypothetical protein